MGQWHKEKVREKMSIGGGGGWGEKVGGRTSRDLNKAGIRYARKRKVCKQDGTEEEEEEERESVQLDDLKDTYW